MGGYWRYLKSLGGSKGLYSGRYKVFILHWFLEITEKMLETVFDRRIDVAL